MSSLREMERRDILEELLRRKECSSISLIDENFIKQADFIRDPAKLKASFCTRRAGKSYGDGILLIETCLKYHKCNCLYISLTRSEAEGIIWKDILKELDEKHGLKCTFNETKLRMTFPNGSSITILGVDSDEKQKKKVLGRKYKLIVIDECQAFNIDLRELVYDMLYPACADVEGTIVLSGTPGNRLSGLFYDVTTGLERGWSLHEWSALDNPHMKDNWQKQINDLLARNPALAETAGFQQNYLGRWVVEQDKLVYRYNPIRNEYIGGIPLAGKIIFNMGVDLGYNDDSAFVIGAYSLQDPNGILYIVESFKQKEMDITAVANKIRYFKSKYDLDYIVIDGANKQAVKEMVNRHDLNLNAADKTAKFEYQQMMNDDFILSKIKINKDTCKDLIKELGELIWDERSAKKQEHPKCPNHLADSCLYLWKFCFTYLAKGPVAPVRVGTPEYVEQEVKKMYKEAELALEHKNADDYNDPMWSDNDPFDTL